MKKLTLTQTVSKLPCTACPPPSKEDVQWVLENLERAPRRSDCHHVTTRGAGGTDDAENCMALCRRHHTEWHAIGPKAMIKKYQGVEFWLESAKRFDILNGNK